MKRRLYICRQPGAFGTSGVLYRVYEVHCLRCLEIVADWCATKAVARERMREHARQHGRSR
jgi:hypothetical protein